MADPGVRAACELVVVGPSGTGVDVDERTGGWSAGGSAAAGGQASALAIERAVTLAMNGSVQGIVTAPIDKAALLAAGYDYPGHTEMLAALTGSRVAMMLASETLRVVLATTHIALRDVPRLVTESAIVDAAAITRRYLDAWFGIPSPRIALCALNPHAGDGGRFGDEDATVLAPAARLARIAGPFPADTVFVRALRGEFECGDRALPRRRNDRDQSRLVRPRRERDAGIAIPTHLTRSRDSTRYRGPGHRRSGQLHHRDAPVRAHRRPHRRSYHRL